MRYRAYAKKTVLSKRHRDDDGNPGPLEVEEVIAEGDLKDGRAAFDAGDVKVTKVVFYAGPKNSEVVAGSVDIGKAGRVSVEYAAPEDGKAGRITAG